MFTIANYCDSMERKALQPDEERVHEAGKIIHESFGAVSTDLPLPKKVKVSKSSDLKVSKSSDVKVSKSSDDRRLFASSNLTLNDQDEVDYCLASRKAMGDPFTIETVTNAATISSSTNDILALCGSSQLQKRSFSAMNAHNWKPELEYTHLPSTHGIEHALTYTLYSGDQSPEAAGMPSFDLSSPRETFDDLLSMFLDDNDSGNLKSHGQEQGKDHLVPLATNQYGQVGPSSLGHAGSTQIEVGTAVPNPLSHMHAPNPLTDSSEEVKVNEATLRRTWTSPLPPSQARPSHTQGPTSGTMTESSEHVSDSSVNLEVGALSPKSKARINTKRTVKIRTTAATKQQTGGDGEGVPQSPQSFLDEALVERGYAINRVRFSDSGYQVRPSPLQIASYGTKLIKAINDDDAGSLDSLLSCGLSPNACNAFGDSALDLICRRGSLDLIRCVARYGCDFQVANHFGRTPLHHAAWARNTCFESIELILDADLSQLFITDKRGLSAVECVPKEKWGDWIEFIKSKLDKYWPLQPQSNYKVNKPHRDTAFVADPKHSISSDLSLQVASGVVSVSQAKLLRLRCAGTQKNDSSSSTAVATLFANRRAFAKKKFEGTRAA